ncbi:hypothetical protein CU044_3706 [Streptomyces sp. L-9-10]|nr:hypothetical protein CU044_3706 [Streptomyces sp. L-9-10]
MRSAPLRQRAEALPHGVTEQPAATMVKTEEAPQLVHAKKSVAVRSAEREEA